MLVHIVTAFLIIIFILKNIYAHLTFWRHIYKLPGPPHIIFWGNAFKDVSRFLSPQEAFERFRYFARTYPNLYTLYAPTIGGVVLMTPQDIELLVTNYTHNTKGLTYRALHSWFGTGLLTSTGDKWQQRRKMLTPAFHFSILKEFVNVFNTECDSLVNALEQKCNEPYVNVIPLITEFTLHTIAETSMGVSFKESTEANEKYKKAIYDFGVIFSRRLTRLWLLIPWVYCFSFTKQYEKKALKILHNTSKSVIKKRKETFFNNCSYSAKKRLAMLDLLLKARQEGNANIDDEGLREEVDTFMFEGHDTTSVALCYAVMLLANNRHIQDKIFEEIQEVLGENIKNPPTYADYQEMQYLERCIKECLRLYPSVPMISRTSGESFTTKTGYFIPKGTFVAVGIYDMHRNSTIYEDPEKFDPDRFLPENCKTRHPFAYLPFSAGPRNCIGQKYAILELKAALCGVIRKFMLEPVDTPETVKPRLDMVLRPEDAIIELNLYLENKSCIKIK